MSDKLLINDNLFGFPVKNVKFNSRPISVDAKFRLEWRLAFTLFLIHRLAGTRSISLKRLSLFSWFLLSPDRYGLLVDVIEGRNSLAVSSVKYDPGLIRCVLLLSAYGLISINKNKYKVSSAGAVLAEKIVQEASIFSDEKKLLSQYTQNQMSETRINAVIGRV